MRFLRSKLRLPALAVAIVMLLQTLPTAKACGPHEITPIFAFRSSPDLPLAEFTSGKLGIVRPSFGRKSLVIAYRYLNGGSFTPDQQIELLDALKGKAPEEDSAEAVKAWIDARKAFLQDQPEPSEIYTERQHGYYNFFPNCAKNAFEVALQTLKDRSARYGADDPHVRAWLAAQDVVFQNCAGEAQIPNELGPGSPTWLRKDRDYQIAAAHFYSLNFDEARSRFEKIGADAESPWSSIAGYLVARTLVRQASLAEDEARTRFYTQAEKRLEKLVANGGDYAAASKKLLALVKYHFRPEERMVELAQILSAGSNENLRQDLIDYDWIIGKFESRIRKAEEDRKQTPAPDNQEESPDPLPSYPPELREKMERIQRGELLHIVIFGKLADGTPDYNQRFSLELAYDESETEVLAAFKALLGRAPSEQEAKEILENRKSQLDYRKWQLSPLRKWDQGGLSQFEGCAYYYCDKFALGLVPDFLRAVDLSDWILTFQSKDPAAYSHARAKWRETGSHAWLLTALVKAETSSPGIARLMQSAERLSREEPAFLTIAYHLIRLKTKMGHREAARKLLDEIASLPSDALPVSTQNQFLEQRLQLSRDLNEFLNSAQRKPVAFNDYDGRAGKFADIVEENKSFWNPSFLHATKEEYDRGIEETYKDLLPWDNRVAFEDETREIFDRHFPLPLLIEAARNPNVPDYLQRSLVLAAWTRSILLDKDEIALKIAPSVPKVEPKMASEFASYLAARTVQERRVAALYVLLKFPKLSPYVQGILNSFDTTNENADFYFEQAWWCPPTDTVFTDEGEEVPKVIFKPSFLTAAQLEAARREHQAIVALSDGRSYLGKQAIRWAKTAPDDPRVPEALFIGARANEGSKYGCGGWEFDAKTRDEATSLLRRQYPNSPWTAKLPPPEN